MSDFILKFWPKAEVQVAKIDEITTGLQDMKIIGERTEFWGKPAFKPGALIHEYLEPKLERNNSYFDTIFIKISEKDYGVIPGEEDFDYIDRLNVIAIEGGEGAFNSWTKMCEMLESITGDEYEGGWELL
ncbi:MAG TPA: hypothetical protein VD908_01210 [Cytophagales bacterium]|nr:hypothetical protein [Cytophagales bacterium]